jgi:hypothetical protein
MNGSFLAGAAREADQGAKNSHLLRSLYEASRRV